MSYPKDDAPEKSLQVIDDQDTSIYTPFVNDLISRHDPPMSLSEQRRRLVIQLINERFDGNKSAFARAINRKPGYVSRMTSEDDAPDHKVIGQEMAAHIEEMLGLPQGLLVHPPPVSARSVVRALPQSRLVWVVRTNPTAPRDVWAGGSSKPMGATEEYTEAVFTDDARAYLVQVTDDAMAPRLFNGEYAVVSPSVAPQPGDSVLIRLKDREGDDMHVPRHGMTLLRRYLGAHGSTVGIGSYADATVRYLARDDIEWMHYVPHALPPRFVKRDIPGQQQQQHQQQHFIGNTIGNTNANADSTSDNGSSSTTK